MSEIKKITYVGKTISDLGKNTEIIQSGLTSLKTDVEQIKNNGVTTETVTNTVENKINTMLSDGSLANMTIEDNSITGDKIANDTIGVDKINKNAFSNIFSVEYLTDMVTDKGLDTTNNYSTNCTKTVTNEGINITGSSKTNVQFYDINRATFTYKPSSTDKVLIAFNYKLTSCSLSGNLTASLMLSTGLLFLAFS